MMVVRRLLGRHFTHHRLADDRDPRKSSNLDDGAVNPGKSSVIHNEAVSLGKSSMSNDHGNTSPILCGLRVYH
jgi:hypothetical protein